MKFPSMTTDHSEALGLLILRLGLAWILFVWAVNKILAPAQYQRIWDSFHGLEIGPSLPFVMGGLQVAVCLAMALYQPALSETHCRLASATARQSHCEESLRGD